MQINRKLLSASVVALLLVSMLAFAIPASAAPAVNSARNYNPFDGTLTAYDNATGTTTGSWIQLDGTGANPFSQIFVYWDTPSSANLLNSTAYANSAGAWSVQVKIPSAAKGFHDLIVRDDLAATGFETIKVVEKLSVLPARALPGDTVTLTGHGFAGNVSDSLVEISITGPAGTIDIPSPIVHTNATGSFTVSFVVPDDIETPTDFGTYTITATDGATNTKTTTLTVDYYVTVTPNRGPRGVTVTMAGRIPPNTQYDLRIDSQTVLSGTSAADGRFSQTYQIPSLISESSHTVSVYWVIGSVSYHRDSSTGFTVTAAPTISISPADSGKPGTVITISSTSAFSPLANITLYLGSTVINSTALDARFGPTDAFGRFTNLQFTVPDLAPGVYTLVVVDEFGATTGSAYTFTVSPTPTTSITLSADTYTQGDTVIFNIRTTESSLGTMAVTVRSPSGDIWWCVNGWQLTTPSASVTKFVTFEDQVDDNGNHLVLPTSAPTGTWNWTVDYVPSSTNKGTTATGLFTVSAGGIGGVLDAINELKGTITSVQGDVVTIKTSVGTSLSTTVAAIQGKVTSIENGIATLSIPDLGAITTKLSSIDAVLGSVAGDVATLKTSIGDVTTTLTALNAKVVSIENGIATITTDVGTLQGVVTEVKNGVATISTGIGNVQTSVSNLQPDVVAAKDNSASISTMVYVAVAFAVIAAIAAVASILLMRKKIAS